MKSPQPVTPACFGLMPAGTSSDRGPELRTTRIPAKKNAGMAKTGFHLSL
jgi:hypothetical protein